MKRKDLMLHESLMPQEANNSSGKAPIISLKNIGKSFGKQRVLNNISLDAFES